MKNIYTYRKTNMTWEKKTVYACYFEGEIQSYCTKEKSYTLIEKRTRRGIERHEKHVGYHYHTIGRKRTDEKGNIYFLTLEQLKEEIKEEYKNWLPLAN